MTGYITHATGLRLGVNSIGRAVKRVNLQQHCEWQISITCHLNPVPHFVEYFGHKLHLSPQASFEQLPIIFIIFRNETVNGCSHRLAIAEATTLSKSTDVKPGLQPLDISALICYLLLCVFSLAFRQAP